MTSSQLTHGPTELATPAHLLWNETQAMSIGALPQNAGATAIALAVLADELAFLCGDRSTDLAWYGKRGAIAGIYASTGEGETLLFFTLVFMLSLS